VGGEKEIMFHDVIDLLAAERQKLISKFLEDLKSECLGGKYSECLYTMDSCKCDSDCPNYKLYRKWEERAKK